MVRLDDGVAHGWFQLTMLIAFFKMSRFACSTSTSRRNCSSSASISTTPPLVLACVWLLYNPASDTDCCRCSPDHAPVSNRFATAFHQPHGFPLEFFRVLPAFCYHGFLLLDSGYLSLQFSSTESGQVHLEVSRQAIRQFVAKIVINAKAGSIFYTFPLSHLFRICTVVPTGLEPVSSP